MTATLARTPAQTAANPVRRPVRATTQGRQILSGAFATMGLIFAWFLVYAFVLSPLQEYHEQGVLYSQLREQLAAQTAPVGGTSIGEGKPVALIDFPAAGMHRVVVVEGTSSGDLIKGPGHERDSVLPGQSGISKLQGRAQLFGGPFSKISSVQPGAVIKVTTGEGVATYQVTNVAHAGQPVATDVSPGGGVLLLYTAESSGWRSGWAPSKAVIVAATLTSTPFAGHAGAAIAKSERPMHGDSGALYVLVLWIPVLLAAVLGVLWATNRWGRWQAYLVGVPIILGALWGVSEYVVQLLPNLM